MVILLGLFLYSYGIKGQDSLSFNMSYDIQRNYPSIRMTADKLEKATSLKDLNHNFPASWIKEYKQVEIQAENQGQRRKAVGKNEILSDEQKDLLGNSDPGSEITVNVHYLPNNLLKNNDIKEISFSFTVDPEKPAQFKGGEQKLEQYLKENVMGQIQATSFKKYQMAAVTFTIDEDGLVSNPHLFWPSEDKNVDAILLETICNMPNWKPATYSNGKTVKQEFVLTVGDKESCVANMFNIGKERPSEID